MAGPIIAVVDDLFFLSKIQQAAGQLGVSVEAVDPAKVATRVAGGNVGGVIFDLNHRSGSALEVLRELKGNPGTSHLRALGFVSHVQSHVVAAARAAGCDEILARSAFSQNLSEILRKLAGE